MRWFGALSWLVAPIVLGTTIDFEHFPVANGTLNSDSERRLAFLFGARKKAPVTSPEKSQHAVVTSLQTSQSSELSGTRDSSALPLAASDQEGSESGWPGDEDLPKPSLPLPSIHLPHPLRSNSQPLLMGMWKESLEGAGSSLPSLVARFRGLPGVFTDGATIESSKAVLSFIQIQILIVILSDHVCLRNSGFSGELERWVSYPTGSFPVVGGETTSNHSPPVHRSGLGRQRGLLHNHMAYMG